jgi:predicted dithiol-disulfide oxidoreductase (DUF899 family)
MVSAPTPGSNRSPPSPRGLELLEAEKELTRRSDELARRRQELPWVRADKDYRFETDDGSAALADLFRGRSQLLVYHFMFGPDYSAGCPACSAIADGFDGFVVHLANHDVMLWAVSRAPLATPVPEPDAQLAAMCGTDGPTYSRDRLGMSAFVLEDGVVYHTYFTYRRGVDGLGGMYQWLDRAPRGATRRALVAPPRRVRQALSQVVGVARRRGREFRVCG